MVFYLAPCLRIGVVPGRESGADEPGRRDGVVGGEVDARDAEVGVVPVQRGWGQGQGGRRPGAGREELAPLRRRRLLRRWRRRGQGGLYQTGEYL